MITLDVEHELEQATTIEKLIAQAVSTNPSDTVKFGLATTSYIQKMRKAALRVTAARTRKEIISIYEDNKYGWAKHRDYPNWFGKFGAVSMAGLIAANRPKKAFTKKGNKRKKGYSRTGMIKPPKIYPVGGRLVKSTRYNIKADSMVVGVMETQQDKVKKKMRQFQTGGSFNLLDPERSRRYLAALGMYVKRSTVLNSKPRPLYDKLAIEGDIGKNFQKTFIEMLNDRLRVGE